LLIFRLQLVLYPVILLILILLSVIISLILSKTILYRYIVYYVFDLFHILWCQPVLGFMERKFQFNSIQLLAFKCILFFPSQISQGLFSGNGNQFPAENSEKKLYKFHNCGTAFVHEGDLEPHLKLMCCRAHWQCPYCPRTARAKAHLKQHITCVHMNSAESVTQRRGYIMFK
jgi:hypothetical protein